MINNWTRHNLNMDFNNISCIKGKPCDIDMCYLGKYYMIVGEIKNELGTFTPAQRGIYESLVNGSRKPVAIAIYITHNQKVENGDVNVDVASQKVAEYYIKGKQGWHKPNKDMIVQDVFFWAMKEDEKYGNSRQCKKSFI